MDSQDTNGHTPLHLAALNGKLECVRLLIEQRVMVSARSYKMETPLHIACAHGHDGVVQFLLTKRAKVATRDKVGRTPLQFAFLCGHESTVRLILMRLIYLHGKRWVQSPYIRHRKKVLMR